MDLPIVILDLEDAFQICIPFDEYERLETVRELSACVVQVAKKSIQEARKLASSPRVRPNWTSTLAHR